MGRFENKVVLITGGASGIGRATALAFSTEGANVVIGDWQEAPGQEIADKLTSGGHPAIFVKTDVSNAAQVERLVQVAVETFGRLDVAANIAGIAGARATIAESSEANFDRVIAIDLKGVYLAMKYEIPGMLKNNGGAIVNMASVAGLVASANGLAAYVAAKHGVIGLTKTAALEYAKQGIRINAIAPGLIATPMTEPMLRDAEAHAKATGPMGRTGRPEEIADAVLYLASDDASFITGTTLVVDGGQVAE